MLVETLKKFGYPKTLIKEYNHWIILLRPGQVTLGSLILICKEEQQKYSEIPADAFIEFQIVIKDIEKNLFELFKYDKINYLMLMMVDPEVHFHVIPRYSDDKVIYGEVFKDYGWPKIPMLSKINENHLAFERIYVLIKEKFEETINKYKIVYTTGAFDIFHYGHLNIIKKSKSIADKLIVGVSTDQLIEIEKGRKPFVPFNKRVEILKSIKYVDEVIPQIDKNKQRVVDELKIDAITVGDDWKGKYPKINCDLVYIPYTEEISSTKIKEYFRNN